MHATSDGQEPALGGMVLLKPFGSFLQHRCCLVFLQVRTLHLLPLLLFWYLGTGGCDDQTDQNCNQGKTPC